MKKFIKYIVLIIIAIFLISLLKNAFTYKYSHSDIIDLANKGLKNMDNISFVVSRDGDVIKYYFKGDNKKMVPSDSSLVVISLENGKGYMIDKDGKNMFITSSTELIYHKGIQDYVLNVEELNKDVRYKDQFRYELAYIRDEKIDNKDCIFVKECVYYIDSKEYVDYSYNSENEIPVYWIEKSTGIVIGAALMEAGKDTATPQTTVSNIKFGEVTDDIFNYMNEISDDYNIFEKPENGNIIQIK